MSVTLNEQRNLELRHLLSTNKGLLLFDFNGIAVINPFVDETGIEPVDPVEYYGTENVLEAFVKLSRVNRKKKEDTVGQSGISFIADALKQYNDNGLAVITGNGEHDPRDIAHDVMNVLRGLKCSFRGYYHDVEHSYFIEDCMGE